MKWSSFTHYNYFEVQSIRVNLISPMARIQDSFIIRSPIGKIYTPTPVNRNREIVLSRLYRMIC